MPIMMDNALNQIIRERLQQDRRTAGATVDVNCCEGCISLVGRVDTEEQKQAAVFVVEGLTGVRMIHDHIVVRHVTISD